MAYRMHGALIASVSAAALLLATNQTFARSGAAPGFSAARPNASMIRPFRYHPRHNTGTWWPGARGYYFGPANDERIADVPPDVTPPVSRDIRYTTTYDVPWDWAHRYPPNVVPSDRPYVSSCSSEPVTVPGRNGEEKTINITRCY
ncbi:MAG: hypothetical protein J0H42_06305 [Rhizobiales bacterium]|nr:hypothetical protein [Hyphomicrobiales bacterium]